MRKALFCCIAICVFSATSFSQKNQSTAGKIKVFLDCTRPWLCDYDYVRTEMKMVDFVRDRMVSDVHIMVNTQFSNSGGEQNQLNFLGQGRFSGDNDTLTYFNDPTTTDDEKRKKLVQHLELGLVHYVAKTDAASGIKITYTGKDTDSSKTAALPQKDRWNYWVIQFGASFSMNGNRNYNSHSGYGYINADRETEKLKTSLYVSSQNSTDIFKDTNGDTKFYTKRLEAGGRHVISFTKHWSAGISAAYQRSLYNNIKGGGTVKPMLEYSLFPYSKFNSERIVVQYMLGPLYNQYYDTTIFFKTKEWQLQQSVNIIASFTKPWGSVNLGVFWSNYFETIKKNNLSFNGAVSWKIAKGLNFGVYGYYGLIHDQIALRKGDATRDQLLRQNRELLTSFEYNLGFGFSYRFGSVANSIVNPRFKGLSYSVSF